MLLHLNQIKVNDFYVYKEKGRQETFVSNAPPLAILSLGKNFWKSKEPIIPIGRWRVKSIKKVINKPK